MSGPASNLDLVSAMNFIAGLAAKGGPYLEEYPELTDACIVFSIARNNGCISEAEHSEFMSSLGPAGTLESLMGHIYHKPYGYAGDFEILDKLYCHHVSSDPRVVRWDEYVQQVPLSGSVRNRGPYLHAVLSKALERHNVHLPFHLVSLGSGPARDIAYALNRISRHHIQNVRVTCIDMDGRALAHSQKVLRDFTGAVEYKQVNALRLRLSERADLLWASGLFDYFSDRVFVRVLRNALKQISTGGEIVVGNFSDTCPRHGPMNFAAWQLVLRGRDALHAAAIAAGADPADVDVDMEPQGLNLFLHIGGRHHD